MKTNSNTTKKKKGFTLIEVIAVLVLLGILAAIAIPGYIDLTANAETRALEAGIAEMNGREASTWGNNLLAPGGWTADELPSTDLGTDYTWSVGPDATGGTLDFGSATRALTRTAATATTAGRWN